LQEFGHLIAGAARFLGMPDHCDNFTIAEDGSLKNWQQCLTFLPKKQLLKIPVNPSVSVGKFTRWSPLNPVTLVTTKPDELS